MERAVHSKIYERIEETPSSFPHIVNVDTDVQYLMGCRSFAQFCGTARNLIDPARFCPFCVTERSRRKQKEVAGTDYWMLLQNEYPHKNVQQMWLIVPRRHVTDPTKLQSADWSEVGELLNKCVKEHGVTGGGVMFRFGSPYLNVGTVPHLHLNVIKPIPGQEYRPPFAKNDAELEESYLRMIGFRDQMLLAGGLEWLMSDIGIKATQPPVE